MAKLPEINRIRREDIPDAPDWIEKLLTPLNRFMESVYQALNKQIVFDINITSQIKEVTFTTGGSGALADTVTFPRTMKAKVRGLIPLQIIESADTHTPITSAVFIDWLDINGTINIYAISGLTASTKYTLRVLMI